MMKLSLAKQDAVWLKGLLQNPLPSEDEKGSSRRERLFNALPSCTPLPYPISLYIGWGRMRGGYDSVEEITAAFKAHDPAWTKAMMVESGYLI